MAPRKRSVYTNGVPRMAPHNRMPKHHDSLTPLSGGRACPLWQGENHRHATLRSKLSPFGKVPSPTRRAGLPSPLWQRLGQVFQRVVRVGNLRERAPAWAGVGESGGLTYATSERLDVPRQMGGRAISAGTVAPLAGGGRLAGTQQTQNVVVWPQAT